MRNEQRAVVCALWLIAGCSSSGATDGGGGGGMDAVASNSDAAQPARDAGSSDALPANLDAMPNDSSVGPIDSGSADGSAPIDGGSADAAPADAAPADTGTAPSSYAATVARGDLAVWTLMGDTFSIDWTVTASTGDASAVYTVTGTCSAADPSYGYRGCTVVTSSLTSGMGGTGPAVGDGFYVLDLPGVAMAAHPKGMLAEVRHDLHIGLALGGCSNPGGTFQVNAVHAGVPGNVDRLLQRMSITLDQAGIVSSIDAWDYGLIVNGASSTNMSSDPIRPILMTDPATPHPLPVMGATCNNGVFELPLPGQRLRGVVTRSGVGMVDLPHRPGEVNGSGGLIGLTASSSASVAALAGKQFSGVVVDRNSPVDLFNAVVAPDGTLTIVSTLRASLPANTYVGQITALADPALAVFAGHLVDLASPISGTYGTDALYGPPAGARTAAPAVSALGGLFVTTDGMGHFSESNGRGLFGMAHLAPNGHVMLVAYHFAVNNAAGGTDRCFSGTTLAGNLQQYCIDGELVAFSR
jgi:hypothetical protein